jgi:hypothetical protein
MTQLVHEVFLLDRIRNNHHFFMMRSNRESQENPDE